MEKRCESRPDSPWVWFGANSHVFTSPIYRCVTHVSLYWPPYVRIKNIKKPMAEKKKTLPDGVIFVVPKDLTDGNL